MGYNATTLAQVAVFLATPDVGYGGIWQGGRAPTLDASGNAFFSTGNGTWDGSRNWGDSLLKFSVSVSGLGFLDYFTPSNNGALNTADLDLGGGDIALAAVDIDNLLIEHGQIKAGRLRPIASTI
jgi:hypothetical protein